MATLVYKIVWRSLHVSKVLSRQHKPIPRKIMNPNTYWKYPQFNKQGIQPQRYDHFLVLDFEATCDDNADFKPQEIIEFPCLKVDSKTLDVVDAFHEYVRPEMQPTLTVFCVELTGIVQEMVDDRSVFKDVLSRFLDWLSANNSRPYGENPNSIFITCGDWDLKSMLPRQCELSNLPVPEAMTQWIDLKKAFHQSTGYLPRGMTDMLAQLELPHEGKLHSGIDDCENMARIVKALAERSLVFEKISSDIINSKLKSNVKLDVK